jgi:Putative auto-transporter adhesin, head GIN domain
MTVAPTSAHAGRERYGTRWLLVAILAFLLGGLAVALLYHFDVFGRSSKTINEGSGVSAAQARDVSPFNGVELAGSNNVVIRVGEKQSVVVRGDDNLLDRVTTEVQSGTLVVGNTPGSFTTKSPMSVDVTVPTLSAVTLSGSGNFVVDGVKGESLNVTLPGSGTLTGSGTAKRLDVTVGGSGTVQLAGLVANDVRAVVSGSGTIFVTATASLDGSVSGSGSILYAGNPKSVTRSVTGTGTITGS